MIRRLIFLSIFLPLISCSEEKSTSLHAEPPTYQTFHRPKFHGAFFHFTHKNKIYFACSIHQGGAAQNAEVFLNKNEKSVTLTKRIHTQKDLHIWTADTKNLQTKRALIYRPKTEIKVGDRIVILNKGQKIEAEVAALPQGENFRYTYKTTKKFPAGGMSGSPIYLPRTGSVIGVLQTANHKKEAHFGGFEALTLQ